MTVVGIALGSNLGDRRAHIDSAAAQLQSVLSNLRVSRVFETDPVDVVGPQARFLNAAATGGFEGGARDLLTDLLRIEREHGRGSTARARAAHAGPRPDLLRNRARGRARARRAASAIP